LYEMDRDALERRLKHAKLVIGDVRDTCATFLQEYQPAPIGCMFHDLDYYSSTRDALTPWWPDHVYIHHDFEHPRYNDFVAHKEQVEHENDIKQKN
jgi:hypothetical protein